MGTSSNYYEYQEDVGGNYTDEGLNNLSSLLPRVVNPLEYWVQGVALLAVGSVGTILNIVSILILLKKEIRHSSINTLLLGLQLSDLVFVISAIMTWSLPTLLDQIVLRPIKTTKLCLTPRTRIEGSAFLRIIFYPLSFTAQTASVYFTVMIAAERYIAICHPLKARTLCTPKMSKISAVVILLFSIALNVSKAFEQTVFYNSETSRYENAKTSLMESKTYIWYQKTWGFFIPMFIVPMILLLYCNLRMYATLRRLGSLRAQIRTSSTNGSNPAGSPGISLVLLIFAIVIVFFICTSVSVITISLWFITNDYCMAQYFFPFRAIANVVNCSCNFVFYIAFPSQFRTEFIKMFNYMLKRKTNRGSRNNNEHKSTSSSVGTVISQQQQQTL